MTTRCQIRLFGPFQVTLDGEPATQFGSDTARALCGERTGDVHPYLARLTCPSLDEEADALLRGLDAEGLRYLNFRAHRLPPDLSADSGARWEQFLTGTD